MISVIPTFEFSITISILLCSLWALGQLFSFISTSEPYAHHYLYNNFWSLGRQTCAYTCKLLCIHLSARTTSCHVLSYARARFRSTYTYFVIYVLAFRQMYKFYGYLKTVRQHLSSLQLRLDIRVHISIFTYFLSVLAQHLIASIIRLSVSTHI